MRIMSVPNDHECNPAEFRTIAWLQTSDVEKYMQRPANEG